MKKNSKLVHWLGGIKHPNGIMLPGWPCCCSGDRAEKIAFDPERGTRNPFRVTCKKCLKWMSKDERVQDYMKGR